MNKKKVGLSEQQIKNLLTFLNRIDFKGSEFMALAEILTALTNAQKEVKQVDDKKKK